MARLFWQEGPALGWRDVHGHAEQVSSARHQKERSVSDREGTERQAHADPSPRECGTWKNVSQQNKPRHADRNIEAHRFHRAFSMMVKTRANAEPQKLFLRRAR